MPSFLEIKHRKYARRKKRARAKIAGTPEHPRLSVYKSLKHTYAQIVDDLNGRTLAFVSTLSRAVREKIEPKDDNKSRGFKVGEVLAEMAKARGIDKVVFDRQGNRYHGRIKAVAEGARKGGLKF